MTSSALSRRSLLTLGLAAVAAPALAAGPHLYVVVFEVNADATGKAPVLTVSKVMDPEVSGQKDIMLAVPPEYVAAATRLVAAGFSPAKPHYFTWFYFDSAQPGRADLGMSKS